MGDQPIDHALDTDDLAGAPALVTNGLTPDVAFPTPDELAGDPVAPTARVHRGPIGWLLREPMWVLGLVLFMDEIDKNVVRGMITPLKEDFGVGDLGIGVLLSLALLFNGLITVPAGYLADRWNRTRSIGQTVVGWSVLTAGGAASVGFPMLVGMRSALGFGQAITEPSAASLIGDYYPPDKRGKAFSIQQVMLLAGTGVGVGLGGFIGTNWGWRPALVVVAIPGLLVAWLVLQLKEPKRGTADLMAAIGAGEIEHTDDHVDLFENGFRQFLRDMVSGLRADMRVILQIRTMRYALAGVAALLFTVTALAAWLPQYYERHLHMAEGTGEALFTALIIFGGIPGVLLGGRVADRYASKIQGGRLALPAIFIAGGNLFFTAAYMLRSDVYSESLVATVFLLQLFGIFIMTMAIPGLRAGLTDAIPAHLRGAGFGAFNLVAVVCGQAAAPFIVSLISNGFDENLRVAFLACSPLLFLGAAILFRARKYLDEDMNKIMMAVLQALQDERDREAEKAADQGSHPA
jgi:MFS family permease